MNELLTWPLAAVTVAVVLFLLWLGRRRQQKSRADARRREAERLTLARAEYATRAPRVPAESARQQADDQALREVEAAVSQRLGQQRAEEEQLEAERARVEHEEALRFEAQARRLAEQRAETQRREADEQAAREATEAAEAERLAQERAEAERLAQEAAAREAEARRLADLKAQQEAEAERQAREQAAREAAELQRLEDERAAREAEALRLAAEQAEAERAAAARRRAEEQAAREAAEAAAAAAAALATRELRADETLVLVADDSKIVRVKISRLLTGQTYRVALAESGEQALELMAAELPHLLITDVEMPGIDGFELTRQVRAAAVTADLPVVMITSSDDKQAEAAAAGVTQLLGKPYSEEALIAAIERARLAVRVPA